MRYLSDSAAIVAVLLAALLVGAPSASSAQSQDHENAISSVISISGDSASIQPPAGYVKISVDLNQGAGGKYVYLCYRRGQGFPLTDLTVKLDQGSVGIAGWAALTGDLNQGAGGNYIYLWGTRFPNCQVLQDIGVIVGENTPPPAGWTKINADLNAGAGGEFIYVVYRLGDNSFLM